MNTKQTIDWNKPVQTRDGKPVKIISTNGHHNFPVVGYVDDDEMPICWNANGKFSVDRSCIHPLDLINVPEKRKFEAWVNIYGGSHSASNCTHPSKADADHASYKDRIACLHIVCEYTEGEGLS